MNKIFPKLVAQVCPHILKCNGNNNNNNNNNNDNNNNNNKLYVHYTKLIIAFKYLL